jgi:hypothetical protein
MHNDNHEKMFTEFIDIRNVGRLALENIDWVFKFACSNFNFYSK